MHDIVNKLNYIVRGTFSRYTDFEKKRNLRSYDAHFQFRHTWTGDLKIPHIFLIYVFISYNRGFPKIDHSGINARIVLEQNKFSKKATSNRTQPKDCSAHFLCTVSCLAN